VSVLETVKVPLGITHMLHAQYFNYVYPHMKFLQIVKHQLDFVLLVSNAKILYYFNKNVPSVLYRITLEYVYDILFGVIVCTGILRNGGRAF